MNNNRKRAGFTLIELMVTVFIMSTLASITIVNFRAGERQKRLQLAADGVLNAIRNAQNFTLTSKQVPVGNAIPVCTISGIVDKAPKSYIIMFGSSNTQALYVVDKCDNVITAETYNYPSGIQVRANGYLINGSIVSSLQLKFTPPFAGLTSSSSAVANVGPFNTFTTSVITLEPTSGGTTRVITIDGISGRVQ